MSKTILSKNVNIQPDLKLMKKLQCSEEYIQNKMQIDCITKVLVEHADVPKELIDWLVESVKKNTLLECEYYNRKMKVKHNKAI